MKCSHCGAKNDASQKVCKDCGFALHSQSDTQTTTTVSELIGKDVEVLFFTDSFTGKISGIVNPSQDQIYRYKDGLLQHVTISTGVSSVSDEMAGTLLTFIRQSKDYLGENFNENNYRSWSTAELKKEYLRLFEKIFLRAKIQPQESKPQGISDKPEKK